MSVIMRRNLRQGLERARERDVEGRMEMRELVVRKEIVSRELESGEGV